MKKAFIDTHEQIVGPQHSIECGTTALVAYVRENTAYVANVGDSRAVLAMADGSVKRVTRDHKADDPIEVEVCLSVSSNVCF